MTAHFFRYISPKQHDHFNKQDLQHTFLTHNQSDENEGKHRIGGKKRAAITVALPYRKKLKKSAPKPASKGVRLQPKTVKKCERHFVAGNEQTNLPLYTY